MAKESEAAVQIILDFMKRLEEKTKEVIGRVDHPIGRKIACKIVEDTIITSINEITEEYKEENDLYPDYRSTNRDSLIRVIQNMRKEDFRRFLCDLAGLHYCVDDDKLYEELKFKTKL